MASIKAKLIDDLLAENQRLRHEVEDEKTKNKALRQELNLNQEVKIQMMKTQFHELNSAFLHLKSLYDKEEADRGQLNARLKNWLQQAKQELDSTKIQYKQLSDKHTELLCHYNPLFFENERLKTKLEQQVAMTQQWLQTSTNFNLKCERLKKELYWTKQEMLKNCECIKLKSEMAEMKECQICNEMFDHGKHQPAKANCGHVLYCKSCLTKIGNTNGKCPSCRKQFKSDDVVAVNLSFI